MPSTSTVYKSAGACTDTTLPIQFKDPAATPGTIFCFDALDTTSYPSQAAPGASDVWKNLMDSGDASFSTVRPGWANGFTFDGSSVQQILGPTTAKMAANHLQGFFVSVWVKLATVAAGNNHIIGMGDGALGTSQFVVYRSGAILTFWINGAAGPQYSAAQAGVVYQIGVGYQGDGAGNFTRSTWLNGVQIGATTGSAASIIQPSATRPIIGRDANIGNFNGTVYRAMYDDLSSGATVAALVAADYAAGVGRFS